MDSGGYDCNFNEDPAEIFKCIVCKFVLKNPMILVECGHRVCLCCLQQMTTYAEQGGVLCPHDRLQVDVNNVVEDKGISRTILDFKVKCDNSSIGCHWVGELRHLQKHCDDQCHLNASKKNSKLIEQLMERVHSCESKLVEKDNEIEVLNELNQKFEAQIQALQNQVRDLTEKISIQSSVQAETRSVGGMIKIPHLGSLADPDPEVKKLIEDFESEIFRLKKEVMNVHEYVPGKETIFKWSIDIEYWYEIYKGIGEGYSRKFYSRPKGHCCMLSIVWEDKDKEDQVSVYLHNCIGFKDEIVYEPLDMGLTLEAISKDGQRRVEYISKAEMLESHDEYLDILGGETRSLGIGAPQFLDTPALNDFIIDGSLTLICTLSEE